MFLHFSIQSYRIWISDDKTLSNLSLSVFKLKRNEAFSLVFLLCAGKYFQIQFKFNSGKRHHSSLWWWECPVSSIHRVVWTEIKILNYNSVKFIRGLWGVLQYAVVPVKWWDLSRWWFSFPSGILPIVS